MGWLKLYNCFVPCLLDHFKSYLQSESRLHISEFSGYHCTLHVSICITVNSGLFKVYRTVPTIRKLRQVYNYNTDYRRLNGINHLLLVRLLCPPTLKAAWSDPVQHELYMHSVGPSSLDYLVTRPVLCNKCSLY